MKQIDIESVQSLDPSAFFSIRETARLLGLTHGGVLRRIRIGRIKAGKNGMRYIILGKEIQSQVRVSAMEL